MVASMLYTKDGPLTHLYTLQFCVSICLGGLAFDVVIGIVLLYQVPAFELIASAICAAVQLGAGIYFFIQVFYAHFILQKALKNKKKVVSHSLLGKHMISYDSC